MTVAKILAQLRRRQISDEEARIQIAALLQESVPGLDIFTARERANAFIAATQATPAGFGFPEAGEERAFRPFAPGELPPPADPEAFRAGPTPLPFFGERGGQATAFRSALQGRFPGGLGQQVERGLQRQAEALTPAFDFLHRFGQLGSGVAFPEFLEANLGTAGINPRAIAGQASRLLSQGAEGLGTGAAGALDQLRGNFPLQQSIALQAALQGTPARFSGNIAERVAREAAAIETAAPRGLTGAPELKNIDLLNQLLSSLFPNPELRPGGL